jgi:hypothetical protein
MNGSRSVPVASRSASARARGVAVRRTQRDSQTLLVAGLTLLATLIALYDLVLLAVAVH